MGTFAFSLLAQFSTLPQVVPPETRPQLELRVFEADGRRARVDANGHESFGSSHRILFCIHCPPGQVPHPWLDDAEGAGPLFAGTADATFYVTPGERYVYAYVGKDIQPIEGEVTIGAHDPLTVRELHVSPVRDQGRLRLALSRPDGTRIQHDFQVGLESLASGLTLFRSQHSRSESWYGDLLPAGRYRVRVETEENALGFCGNGWNPAPAPFGDWVAVVDVRPGETTELDARMWKGGKLRLALDLPPGMPAREEIWGKQFPTDHEPPEAGWIRLGMRGPAARVTLRVDPDAPRPRREPGMSGFPATLRFCMPKLMIAYHSGAILPGDEETSADWIPPGHYIARIEARDFEPAEAKILIRADETTALRVQLVAR